MIGKNWSLCTSGIWPFSLWSLYKTVYTCSLISCVLRGVASTLLNVLRHY